MIELIYVLFAGIAVFWVTLPIYFLNLFAKGYTEGIAVGACVGSAVSMLGFYVMCGGLWLVGEFLIK